mgnify:CR=1 FL=1
MSTQHTPGPWSVERDRAKSLSLYAGTTFIGEVYHDKDEPSTEEQGNVNLIAAAPAMYEALVETMRVLRSLRDNKEEWYTLVTPELLTAWDKNKAALAQAEGCQS